MKVKVIEHAEKQEIYSSSLNTRASYKQKTFPSSSGLTDMHVNELRFPGIHYLFIQLQVKRSTYLRLDYTQAGYCVCFVLEGECSFGEGLNKGRISAHQYVLQPTHETLWLSHAASSRVLFLCFDLKRIQGVLLSNQTPRTLPHHMNRVLSEILQCTQDCPIRCIFIESKILSLLYLLCEDVQEENLETINHPVAGFSALDVQKLKEAEEYIVQHLAENYTLIALAHEVGLNDFKLKKGFKALFGSTVFTYRHSIRMIKAKEMLQSGFPVNEVSEEIGYKHAHHFSAAFKAYFNISPSRI